MATVSPVTAEVVRWALEEDGRSSADVADRLAVDEDQLLAWARGDARPTRGQVTKLADVLRRPRALFFLPAAPVAAALPAAFRHPPGGAGDVSASARMQVRQTRRVQDAVAWALQDAPALGVPRFELRDAPDDVGHKIRQWLETTVGEQAGWSDDYEALRGWRTALERRGILVFALDLGRDDVRGFASWDDRAPVITLNRSGHAPAARCFTLMHELGHLVTRSDSACLEPDGDVLSVDVERWCEALAASVLMPPADVRNFARERSIALESASVEDVKAMTRRFNVSARAAAIRLRDMGFADPGLYALVLRIFRPTQPPTSLAREIRRAPRHVDRVRQYGPRALELVLSTLSPRDALNVLRMQVQDVRALADTVLPGADERF